MAFAHCIFIAICLQGCHSLYQTGNASSVHNVTHFCSRHWIASATSLFEVYRNGIQKILEESVPPADVSVSIGGQLNVTQTKLSFLTSFARGKNFSSPSQELWARGILRFYLNQASSSVLNVIGVFPIGTQVSMVYKCVEMVEAIKVESDRYVILCSPRLRNLIHRHIQSDICLGIPQENRKRPNVTVVSAVRSSLGPLSLSPLINCESLYKPAADLKDVATDSIVSLLSSLKSVIPNVDEITTELTSKYDLIGQFESTLLSENNSVTGRIGTSPHDWLIWKRERFTQLDVTVGKVLDSIFDKLTPSLRQLIRKSCNAFSAAIKAASILEAKCLNITIEPSEIGRGECWLSARIDEDEPAVASRAVISPASGDIPLNCQIHWKPVIEIRKAAITATVTILTPLKDNVLPNVETLIRDLKDKVAKTIDFARQLNRGPTNEVSSMDWVLMKRRKFPEMDREVAKVLEAVFSLLPASVLNGIQTQCNIHRAAVRVASVLEYQCRKLDIEPIIIRPGEFMCLTGLTEEPDVSAGTSILPGLHLPLTDCQSLSFTAVEEGREISLATVVAILEPLKDTVLPNVDTLIKELTSTVDAVIQFSKELISGDKSLTNSGMQPTDWVLWKRETFPKMDREVGKVLDAVFDILPVDVRKGIQVQCDIYKKAVRDGSIQEAKCLNISIEPVIIKPGELFCLSKMAPDMSPRDRD